MKHGLPKNATRKYGAIAVYEDYPELAREVIDRAYNTITPAKADYEPDGTEWDVPNPGTILVGFEVTVPANSRETIDVKFIPGSSDTDAGFDRNLAAW